MPLGSSSAAPVISPGPSRFRRGTWARSRCSSTGFTARHATRAAFHFACFWRPDCLLIVHVEQPAFRFLVVGAAPPLHQALVRLGVVDAVIGEVALAAAVQARHGARAALWRAQ